MSGRLVLAALALALAAPLDAVAGGRWHGGHGGGISFGFYWPGYPYPYARYGYAPYGYPGYWYPRAYWYPPPYWYPPAYRVPPPPEDAPSSEREPRDDEAARRATYGLVQLRGVPDGATVDLDGRRWLRAERLDDRWLALPEGPHTLVVRRRGERPVERRVEIESGETHVVRFDTRTPPSGPRLP